MNYNREIVRRRNHSFDALISGKEMLLKENKNLQKTRNNSFFKEKSIPLRTVYTSICKKFYPLINVHYNKISKKCSQHFKIYGFYCFTCEEHYCLECQSKHKGHSVINFDEININEKEIKNEENSVQKKISSFFKGKINKKTDKKTYELLMNLKNEMIKFNYFIIDNYKNDKNNFYNFYNYYYLYKLKEDLKSDKNDLLKKYFGLRGFKTIIRNLKYFYEKQKHRWLLKNLIEYRKNEIRKNMVKKRKKTYTFENLDTLIKNEGYDEEIIKLMKDIIIEVKDRKDLKKKIFNFIISAVDIFRLNPQKFSKELNVILDQVKINFKEMVKQKVGNTEDVQKFMKSNNSSYYVENNYKNNEYIDNTKSTEENNRVIINEKKTNYIHVKRETTKYEKKAKKEYDLYNGFNVNSYGPKYLSLDISNTFKANNNNNNYQEITGTYTSKNNTYTSNEVENIYIYDEPKKKDILNSLFNVDKKTGSSFSIDIDTSNTIRANNNNNAVEILHRNEVYENNNVTHNTTVNYNKNLYDEKTPKLKSEMNDTKIDHIDIINNEIKKNNSNESESNVYTHNYKRDHCKVNNDNCKISLKKTEKIVKNTDIVINNEENYNDHEIKKIEGDRDININVEIKNNNNNQIILEKEKLKLENKEVNMDVKYDLFVDKVEIKDKLSKENKSYIKDNQDEERRKKEDEEKRKREEDEEKRKREEEERRRPKYQKISTNVKNRICNKCYSNCDLNCMADSWSDCCAFNGNEYCQRCGCYKDYHEGCYYKYVKN